MAEDGWYYAIGDAREGPVPRADVERLWREGRLGPRDLVWGSGMADWAEAGTVLGARPDGPASAPPAPGPTWAMPRVAARPAPTTRPTERTPKPSAAQRRAKALRERDEAPAVAAGRRVGLGEAMRLGFENYADFTGRASRPEFWWWWAGTTLVWIALVAVSPALDRPTLVGFLAIGWSLATLVPTLSVTARRLHDTGRSGWLQLVALIPLIGPLLLLVWLASPSMPGPNRHG